MNTPQTDAAGRPTRRGQIWIVDDSPLETELARRVLADEHDVQVFFDGPSIIEQLANGERPDVIVLDWHMPEMTGLDVCRFLRESYDEASLPILILTATGGQDDLLEGLAAGANDFVGKSFDPAELRARVATLVRSKVLFESLKSAGAAASRALQEAEEANRAKDVFLATVSHELRTPLNAILGWSRLLDQENVDSATLKRGLGVIERNAKIQVQLIEDILDVSRVISSKLKLDRTTVDVVPIARAVLESAKPAADAKQLSVEVYLEQQGARVYADPDRLQQAIWNLMSNAVKFTPAHGRIWLSVRRAAGCVEVEVADTGRGIAADFLPHVFERFRQQDESTSRRYSGLGLGLALVHHIVQAHGGSVVAESAGEGLGATFTLRVPANPTEGTSESERPGPAAPSRPLAGLPRALLGGLDVLVVEDNADARELLVALLAQQGASVRAVGSCREALASVERRAPDLLLSDIGLPEVDGYELARQLRIRGYSPQALPAIALTSHARREDRRRALQAGFQAHIAKPVEPSELISSAAALCGRSNRS